MGGKKKKRREAQRVVSRPEPAQEPESEAGESWFHAKGPALRFVLITAGFMLLFYGVFYSPPDENPTVDAFIRGYLGVYASLSASILDLFGFDASSAGTAVFLDHRRVEVVRGCDAMEPIALFVAAVIAVQVPWRAKLIGLVGVPVLMLVNLFRIMVLSVISSKFPDSFETAHLTVGQTVFVVATLALWFGWVTWASRDEKEPDTAGTA